MVLDWTFCMIIGKIKVSKVTSFYPVLITYNYKLFYSKFIATKSRNPLIIYYSNIQFFSFNITFLTRPLFANQCNSFY